MKDTQLTAEEMIIIDRLKQMKMSGMAEAYEGQLRNPNADLCGFYERFSNIVNFEWEQRFNKKFNRFLKKATLRYPQASFDATIYEPARMLDTEMHIAKLIGRVYGAKQPHSVSEQPVNDV